MIEIFEEMAAVMDVAVAVDAAVAVIVVVAGVVTEEIAAVVDEDMDVAGREIFVSRQRAVINVSVSRSRAELLS